MIKVFRLAIQWMMCLIGIYPATAQNFTNSGTDFWLAFPEFYDLTSAQYIIYISSTQPTSGVVQIPGTGFSQSFITTNGQVTKVNLPSNDATIQTTSTILNRGIHVTSSRPISVYAGTIHNARSEASLVLPTPSLGTDYRVMAYFTQTKNNALRRSEFIIVGTANNTPVAITPTCDTESGENADSTYYITLNQGEIFMLQAMNLNDDLTGTHIKSTNPIKKIAVFAGHEWAQILCGVNADPLYEQMFPIPSWGLSYIMLPTPTSGKDVGRVLASADNTTIDFNGGSPITLNAGEVHEFVYTSTTVVEADKPVCVGIFTITARSCGNSTHGDPSMIIINPNEQMLLDSITFFTVDDYAIAESFIHVLTRTEDTGRIELNGLKLSGFTAISYDTFYSSTSFKVPAGSYQLTTTGCGFLAYAIGLGNAESYAYAAGVSLIDLECDLSFEPTSATCKDYLVDSDVRFWACHNRSNFTYRWDFGDSTRDSGSEAIKRFNKPGTYTVRLITASNCEADTSFKTIVVRENLLELDLFPDTAICNNPSGVELNVFRSEYSSYLWEDSTTDYVRTIFNPGSYVVQITDTAGCQFVDTISVVPRSEPIVELGDSFYLCFGDSLKFEAPAGYNYLWEGSRLDTAQVITVKEAGIFKITITDDVGCYGEDTAEVFEVQSVNDLLIPNVFTPGADKLNDTYFIPFSNFSSRYFRIYNRWGELVYAAEENEDVNWDGTHNDVHLPPGTYYWVSEFGSACRDFKKWSGTVTLIR